MNHPNICTIHEINDDGDAPFIAVEYVEGETLAEKIRRRNYDLAEALDVALQIADALAEAHAHGVVHRDVKPTNVIVNRRGRVKILDFGLAKKIAAGGEAETQQLLSEAGMILRTAAYMSPEQARGLQVDARTDVWSFGVLLYEMLIHRQPFTGDTTTDVLASILTKEPKPLREWRQEVPAELERIVLKTLAKEKRDRYQTAKDLLTDLQRLRKRLEFEAELERTSPPDGKAEAQTQIIRAGTTAETETRNSIAVLPFANMSAEAENDYFCDGLAEELLNALAKIDDLKAPPFTRRPAARARARRAPGAESSPRATSGSAQRTPACAPSCAARRARPRSPSTLRP